MTSSPHATALRDLLHPDRVSTAPHDLAHYGRDWTRQFAPAPSAVAWPESVDDVQDLVRWARASGVALVPSGGRTGLSGGAVAANGEVVVSMERMNRILAFDRDDRSLRVEAGVVTQAVQDRARELGLFYPVDFASRGSSQIGGNVATNAGGIRVLRYGLTRNWVTGLRVVSGQGDVLDLNRGLAKNATGIDLRHLVIGSEGTLAIVVEATLQLAEAPPPQQVMVLAVPELAGLMAAFDALRGRLRLSAFEFFTDRALRHVLAHGARPAYATQAPFHVLAEFDADEPAALAAFEAAASAGAIVDGVISQSLAQAAELWRLRESITESLAAHRPYKNDIAVRVAAVPAFLDDMRTLFAREYPDWEVVWFGHLGDGNLHISVLKPEGIDDAAFVAACARVTGLLCDVLAAHGGSISAEHGVGLLKKPWLAQVRSAAELDLMRGIKRTWDPGNILNPGKILD